MKKGVAYQIQIQVPERKMNSIEELKNVLTSSVSAQSVLLRNVAEVTEGTMVGEFDHFDMQRVISVTANIQDADLGTVAQK